MGKIIKDRYPELDEADQEAVRQHAIAALNLTQKAKEVAFGGGGGGDDDDKGVNTAFVEGVRKFAMNVRDLDIDLIDSINPFGEAYSILAKTMQPTFLMADVEVVATYELFNINRTKLETLIHRVFGPAQLEIAIKDRFGKPVVPREWFLVPIFAIDEAVEKIKDGTITSYVYNPAAARLQRR
jgi:hypothetical protein